MSAVVLGKRNSASSFEELSHHPAAGATITPPSVSASKKARFASSPSSMLAQVTHSSLSSLFSPQRPGNAEAEGNLRAFEHLRTLFPEIDDQALEKELEAFDYDLDLAIKRLEEFRCISRKQELDSEDNSEWVDQLVREMMYATNMDDARRTASSMLNALKESITAQATIKADENINKENVTLKEKVEGLQHDNNILKRAVAIQHERQKEMHAKAQQGDQELQHLRQLVGQYQQQIQTLEINNYSLSMHLRQAQQGSSMPGRFHPDVY